MREIKNKFFLTYKGPKVDAETKTREEIEIPVEENITAILEKLGFTKWRSVKKERKTYKLNDLTICLDDVQGLGSFMEIETGDYENKNKIFKLFQKLGVDKKDFITKSYAELFDW